MKEKKNQEPRIFKVFRIMAPIMLIVGVLLIVLSFTAFRVKEWHGYQPQWGVLAPGIILAFFSIPMFFIGLIPKIEKLAIKTRKYAYDENKEDLTDIAETSADITSGAITKTARAIKKGLKNTMFCKHCGAEIDADSKFCNSCGKEQ